MTPRVLHLLSCDDWGGTEVQVAMSVEHGDPDRCVHHVATLAPPGVLTASLATKGVSVASLSGRLGPIGSIVRLARLLRRWRIDVLQVYGFRAGLVARPAALMGGRPALIVGIRGPHFVDAPVESTRARFALFVERVLAPTVTRYVANSHGAVTLLRTRGFPAHKLTVIPNGIEFPEPTRRAPPRQPPRIICVARFTPSKRHDVLLHALGQLRDGGVDVSCTLVGDGDTLDATRDLAATLDLIQRIRFTGRIEPHGVDSELAVADLFVLASEREGMPGSVLEAMAAGLPVVATDVEGTREVVEHEVSGLLVPPGDATALADAIGRLVRNPTLMRTIGAEGRRIVEARFAVDRLAAAQGDLYAELVDARRRRRKSA